MLQQEYGIRYSQAYQLMAESTKLYGKIDDIDKAGTTKILVEGLYIAISIAVKERNSDAIISATREIGRLLKLHEEQSALTPEELMPARVAKYVQNNITINNNGQEGQADE